MDTFARENYRFEKYTYMFKITKMVIISSPPHSKTMIGYPYYTGRNSVYN